MTASVVPEYAGSYPTFNDRLVQTVTGGASDLQIRSGDDRTYRIVRVSDGQTLQNINDLTAAVARCNQMISSGEV